MSFEGRQEWEHLIEKLWAEKKVKNNSHKLKS